MGVIILEVKYLWHKESNIHYFIINFIKFLLHNHLLPISLLYANLIWLYNKVVTKVAECNILFLFYDVLLYKDGGIRLFNFEVIYS